jgi:hypothetical protein
MESLLFLTMMIAMAWIAYWSVRDPGQPSKIWWPWDMRETVDKPKAPEPQDWRARRAAKARPARVRR